MNDKSTLLKYKKNINSQNGDDGIIARIFDILGEGSRMCCEFGAWDGIHLSNCRELIEDGWAAVLIEGDTERYRSLEINYADNEEVHCINCFVDTETNKVNDICDRSGFSQIDFLSIDIDGLDYNIFIDLGFKPRVICVEVNAGHSPLIDEIIEFDIAKDNVGQPLQLFMKAARKNGYALVAYNGNAYFIREELISDTLPSLSAEEAYIDFLAYLDRDAKEWLWLVNKGMVLPTYRYDNHFLSRTALQINFFRALVISGKIARKIGYRKFLDRLLGLMKLAVAQKRGLVIKINKS